MRLFLASLLVSIFFYSCSTDESEVFKDIISYNASVLNKAVSDCKIIDDHAGCANKTESYIIECAGSDYWYKWDYITGTENPIAVYTIPKNFKHYNCNPELDYKKEFKAHRKSSSGWVAEEYSDK